MNELAAEQFIEDLKKQIEEEIPSDKQIIDKIINYVGLMNFAEVRKV